MAARARSLALIAGAAIIANGAVFVVGIWGLVVTIRQTASSNLPISFYVLWISASVAMTLAAVLACISVFKLRSRRVLRGLPIVWIVAVCLVCANYAFDLVRTLFVLVAEFW